MDEGLGRLFGLQGKVAIVTGAAGLLGSRFSETLAGAGAVVVAADRDEDGARALCRRLKEMPGVEAVPIPVDVADRDSVRRMAEAAAAIAGRIDVLVNNAAINAPAGPGAEANFVPFEDYELAWWEETLAVNLTGVFLCAQAVSRQMVRQGGGVMVNIASTYGLVGPDQRIYEGITDEAGRRFVKPAAYCASKGGVLALTRYLATYWAGKGIRVNSLTPGGVWAGQSEQFVRHYSARTPLGAMARLDDLNGALLFLCSEASAYMTGANLVVDGGWTAW